MHGFFPKCFETNPLFTMSCYNPLTSLWFLLMNKFSDKFNLTFFFSFVYFFVTVFCFVAFISLPGQYLQLKLIQGKYLSIHTFSFWHRLVSCNSSAYDLSHSFYVQSNPEDASLTPMAPECPGLLLPSIKSFAPLLCLSWIC